MKSDLLLFKKSNKLSIGKDTIVLLIFVAIVGLSAYIHSLDRENNTFAETITELFSLITGLYLMALIISFFFRCDRLNGKLEGHLIFERDIIHFGNDSIKISDVHQIIIEHSYIKGQFKHQTNTWGPKRYNGTGNYVEIHLTNGETITYHFLQTKQDRIQKYADILKIYYRFSLLNDQNYFNIIAEN